jgi:pimeloyl-ACP methyl ester carboxylesterase
MQEQTAMSGNAVTTSVLQHRQIRAAGVTVHAVLAGRDDDPSILFLHGWPQCAASFERIMLALHEEMRVVAIDLPGVGESPTALPANDKRSLARCVFDVAEALALERLTLVGHDVGGQIAYAFLHDYADRLAGAILMDIAIPGVDPWFQVRRNPQIWHFAFHSLPHLPELLVGGHEAEYFDYFFDAIAAEPSGVSARARATYARAYSRPDALHTGFEWYRAFQRDEADNAATKGHLITTPVLYLRGERDPGGIPLDRYLQGLREAGLANVTGHTIPKSGHFAPDEQPDAVAVLVREFVLGRQATRAKTESRES